MADTPPTALTIFLAKHDVPCPNPKCGFNLRGLKNATCPECQEPLNLTVRRPEALWYVRKYVVTAAFALVIGASLLAWAWADYWNLERLGFVGQPLHFVLVCVAVSAALGLAISLVRYVVDSRRKDPRAIPRLLWSFLVATVLQATTIATAVGVILFG